ncbi:hypothetical protein NDU88_003294 [Pleurodeles waltl]|uniref:Uncharacterized protein n=1 Tax=Pleurodeles waltl TaxID=8319 RepID=A0AAV7P9I3_PLEWA|nr:hypothetical protein NDU88_003294 [Pleurodeles waltl]
MGVDDRVLLLCVHLLLQFVETGWIVKVLTAVLLVDAKVFGFQGNISAKLLASAKAEVADAYGRFSIEVARIEAAGLEGFFDGEP